MTNNKMNYKPVKFIFMMVLFVPLVGLVTMLLWNALIPALFAGPVLTIWQAFGLLILAKIFFGFGGHKSKCNNCDGQHRGHWKHSWKKKWQDKMECMSEEEKEKFKDEMSNMKCGPWGMKDWMKKQKSQMTFDDEIDIQDEDATQQQM